MLTEKRAAPTAVVTTRHVKRALKARKYRPLLFVDLAVPRNVDPMVDGLEEAFLYNIDDLVGIVSEGQEARQKASDGAGRLIEREADRFLGHLAEVDVGARLGELTGRMEAIRAQELSRSRRLRESLGEDQLAHLDAMTRALVKKILHQPMQRIRQAAREGDATRVDQLLAAWEEEE